MTRRGAWAARCLFARAPNVERFEERCLLSTIGPAAEPPGTGWAVAPLTLRAFVSKVSATAPGSPPAAEGIGEVVPGDGGIGPGLPGRATITVSDSPLLLDGPVVPLVGAARALGPNDPMVMGAGSPDALDLAIEKAFPVRATELTTALAIKGDNSGAIASGASAVAGATDVAVAAKGELASMATTSGANGSLVVVPAPSPPFDLPGLAVATAPALAGSGGVFVATDQASGSVLADDPSGDPVAVASFAGPLLPAGVLASLPMGINGQANITYSVVGGGASISDYGFTATGVQTADPHFILAGPGDAMIQVSAPALAVATPGYFVLGPLSGKTGDASVRVAASGASALGVVANSGIAAAVVEIGAADLVASGPSRATANGGRAPAGEPAVVLGGRTLAAMATNRDAHDWRNSDIVDVVKPDPPHAGDTAAPFAPAEPTPQQLGPIVDLRPSDRLAVDQAIDQFLEHLELLGSGLSSLHESMDIAAELLVLAVVLTGWFVAPRILKRSPGESGPVAYDDATSLDGISGLAGGGMSAEES